MSLVDEKLALPHAWKLATCIFTNLHVEKKVRVKGIVDDANVKIQCRRKKIYVISSKDLFTQDNHYQKFEFSFQDSQCAIFAT